MKVAESIFTKGEVFVPEGDRTYNATESDPIAIVSIYEQNNDTRLRPIIVLSSICLL